MKHYKTIQINGRQVRLHRYLIEQKIGRELSFNEIVHHKNGDKFDNSLDNLEIISRGEHMKIHPEIIGKWKDKNEYKFDNNVLAEMYETMNISDVAKYFGVAPMTIWYRLKKMGIKTKKIDSNDLIEIRKLLCEKIPQKIIAKKYDVSVQTISNIKTGIRYGNR